MYFKPVREDTLKYFQSDKSESKQKKDNGDYIKSILHEVNLYGYAYASNKRQVLDKFKKIKGIQVEIENDYLIISKV